MPLLRPALWLALTCSCAAPARPAPPPAATPEPRTTPPEPEAQAASDDGGDPACAEPSQAEKLEVARSQTVRTSSGLAVTYRGLEHDSFEGGRTDSIAALTFQGVLEDGRLTPSAFSWRPSAFAKPSWVHLGSMPVCVRISSATEQTIALEVYRAPPRR